MRSIEIVSSILHIRLGVWPFPPRTDLLRIHGKRRCGVSLSNGEIPQKIRCPSSYENPQSFFFQNEKIRKPYKQSGRYSSVLYKAVGIRRMVCRRQQTNKYQKRMGKILTMINFNFLEQNTSYELCCTKSLNPTPTKQYLKEFA